MAWPGPESQLVISCSLQAVEVDEPTECGSALAYIYFISWPSHNVHTYIFPVTAQRRRYTIFVSFVILNLFIAVIFEGFEESSSAGPSGSRVPAQRWPFLKCTVFAK